MMRKLKRIIFALICKRFKGVKLLDEQGAWYDSNEPLLWAYAGGGSLRRYGNAVEDIDASIKNGFLVIELDFAQSADGIPLMTHFFKPEDSENEWDHVPTAAEFLAKKVNGKYTPLDFSGFIKRYANSGCFFSLDPFYYYCNVQDGERKFREYVLSHTTAAERKHLILQLYSFKTLVEMRGNHDFGALHYVIGIGNFWKVKYLIPLLTEAGVRSVSFQDCQFTDEMFEAIKLLHAANIRVSAAGVNTIDRYQEVKKVGVNLVNTASLTPNLIKE